MPRRRITRSQNLNGEMGNQKLHQNWTVSYGPYKVLMFRKPNHIYKSLDVQATKKKKGIFLLRE